MLKLNLRGVDRKSQLSSALIPDFPAALYIRRERERHPLKAASSLIKAAQIVLRKRQTKEQTVLSYLH